MFLRPVIFPVFMREGEVSGGGGVVELTADSRVVGVQRLRVACVGSCKSRFICLFRPLVLL